MVVIVTHSCPEIDQAKQQGKSNIYTAPQGMACLSTKFVVFLMVGCGNDSIG